MGEEEPALQGYLLKWTNYMTGFQRRYFVLDRGILSYYWCGRRPSRSCRRGRPNRQRRRQQSRANKCDLFAYKSEEQRWLTVSAIRLYPIF